MLILNIVDLMGVFWNKRKEYYCVFKKNKEIVLLFFVMYDIFNLICDD